MKARMCTLFLLIVVCMTIFSLNANAEVPCVPYEVIPNGCSDGNYDRDVNFFTDFEGACNLHDICYGTIGETRLNCDNDFATDMTNSCKDKYLSFVAWKKVGTEQVLEWGWYCSTFWGGSLLCWAYVTKDKFDWVEVAEELADKSIPLPGFATCMDAVPIYYDGVRAGGGTPYDDRQETSLNYAETLAGSCSNSTAVTPSDSNLFAANDMDVFNALYNGILSRAPTATEGINFNESYPRESNWEYHTINSLVYIRDSTQIPNISYCSTAGTNTLYEWVDRVQLGSLDNLSGNNNGYYLDPSIISTVGTGSTGLSLSAGGTFSEHWQVWIDFNRDGSFTVDERIYAGRSNSVNTTVTIPQFVSVTKMRVTMNFGGYESACTNPYYGEVEDYWISNN